MPAVVFAPKINERPTSYSIGAKNISVSRCALSVRAGRESKLTPLHAQYAEEVDLAYFARVTLADGEVIEVAAGSTTFLPPASWPSNTTQLQKHERRVLHFGANTEVEPLFGNTDWNSTRNEAGRQNLKLDELDLTVTLDELPTFTQGEHIMPCRVEASAPSDTHLYYR